MWNASDIDSKLAIRAHRVAPFAIAALLGTSIGLALAQDRPPGQLDVACANHCAASGYDADDCGKVCRIPAPTKVRPDETTDWICMTDCRDRGGKYLDCKQRCKLR